MLSSIGSATSALNYTAGPIPNQVTQPTGIASSKSETDTIATDNASTVNAQASSSVTLSSSSDAASGAQTNSALPIYTSSGLVNSFVKPGNSLQGEAASAQSLLLTASPATSTAFGAQTAVSNAAGVGLVSNLESLPSFSIPEDSLASGLNATGIGANTESSSTVGSASGTSSGGIALTSNSVASTGNASASSGAVSEQSYASRSSSFSSSSNFGNVSIKA